MFPETNLQPSLLQPQRVALAILKKWQGQQGSNLRPAVLETAALPTELYPFTVIDLRQIELRRSAT